MSASKDRETIPPADVTSAIGNLSDIQWIRLRKIAGIYHWVNGMEPDDFLQEALARAMSGVRKCPADQDIVEFLTGVMKSLAGDANRSWWKKNVVATDDFQVSQQACGDRKEPIRGGVGHEHGVDGVYATQVLQKLDSIFKDDEEGAMLLMAKIEGDSAQEIQEALKLSQTEYATILRRIRRRVDAHFTNGWQ